MQGLAQSPGVVGVRLGPGDRSPGPDPLALWRQAASLGLPVSCFAIDAKLVAAPDFEQLVRELPGATIVLEHLAGVYIPRSPESAIAPYAWYKTALSLAKYPNTYLKFGGLGEFCQRPLRFPSQFDLSPVPPLLEMALEAFGPRRMMWGSDFRQ